MTSREAARRRLCDIRLRDPFVLVQRQEELYYLYGSTDLNTWSGPGGGFDAYQSVDLEVWEGPFRVFEPPSGFWGKENFWAPEVHEVDGRFFMFATFRGARRRGSAILIGDGPLGPFHPHSDGAVTPETWDSLDGTLFTNDAGDRWLVFCHEWRQAGDGKVCARRLSKDLRTGCGEPQTLFTASSAPWTTPIRQGCHVTDGPFLHRSSTGTLFMFWSSFGRLGYAQGVAASSSGDLFGHWDHSETPLWEVDGGHGMVFRNFEGELTLILHHPNQTPWERALLLPLFEDSAGLRLKRRLDPLKEVIRGFNRGGSRRRKLWFILQFVLGRRGTRTRWGAGVRKKAKP